MDKLGDIELFIKVVKNNGFAAAAREVGLSPASVSIKISRLEDSYGVKLLNRTTRQTALTDEGRKFYQRFLHILSDISEAEEQLKTGRDTLAGPINISAPVDIGQVIIAPLLAKFSEQHPAISAQLNLNDGMVNLIEEGFDLGIRFGVLKDNRMIARKLASNKRVLCASPQYLEKYGKPRHPEELNQHRCLTMIRQGETLNEWFFNDNGEKKAITVNPSLSSNNGNQIRHWAVSGFGIALKSQWDIRDDLKANNLVTLLDEYTQDFELDGINAGADLHIVYPSREYLPERTRAFIDLLIAHFKE